MRLSTKARAMTLRTHFGDSRSADALATLYFALFQGDPLAGGVEPTNAGGYARVALANDSSLWGAISLTTTSISNQLLIAWPTATALWSITGAMNYWAIMDQAALGGGSPLYADLLPSPQTVAAVGDKPRILAGALTITQPAG